MSLSHSSQLIIREKLSGKFQSSLSCPPPVTSARRRAEATEVTEPVVQHRAKPSHLSTKELLTLDQQEFLQAAYLQILQRPADPEGLKTHRQLLQSGLSRKAVLARLRFSPEGERIDAQIQGLGAQGALTKARYQLSIFANKLKLRKS